MESERLRITELEGKEVSYKENLEKASQTELNLKTQLANVITRIPMFSAEKEKDVPQTYEQKLKEIKNQSWTEGE